MLHAISQKKGNLYRRYMGHRDAGEIKVHEEDEITSLIFGPLALMSPKIIADYWRYLLIKCAAPDIPDGDHLTAKMNFWPSRSRNNTRIEPDLQVTFTCADGSTRVLLIELKWRAQLSGEDQLHKQWQIYLDKGERDHGWHMFIGLGISSAVEAKQNQDVWANRLLPLDWLTILSFMEELCRLPIYSDLKPWASQVILVLERLGVVPFRGFQQFCDIDCASLKQLNSMTSIFLHQKERF